MATITTKFNVGDKVFTIDKETMKIREITVGTVSAIITNGGKTKVSYYDEKSYTESYDENVCFASKQELLDYIEQPIEEKK